MIKEEIDLEEIKEIVGEKPMRNSKIVTITGDGKQLSIRIPKEFVNEAKISKGDKFEFELLYENDKPLLRGKVLNA